MASVTAVESQKDSLQVFPLTPVPEEEGERAFEAPPGMQKWLEEKFLQSSSSSLVSTVTDTTEEDKDDEQSKKGEKMQESFYESLPQEERDKLAELLSKTADASAVKERVFSSHIRPPPTPPQDVSMYTNTRRTARSKNEREKGSSKFDNFVESLLKSHSGTNRNGYRDISKAQNNSSQVDEGEKGLKFSAEDKYQIPVHIRDNSSSDSAEELETRPNMAPLKKGEYIKSIFGQLLPQNVWTTLNNWLGLLFSVDVAQNYFHEYLRLVPQVIGYTFAGVGLLYCLFGFMVLLFTVGILVGWFILCALIVSAVVSCILSIGLAVFVVCFICVCTFTVTLFTVLFTANSLLHVADRKKPTL